MESQSPYFVRELECKGKAIRIKQLYVGDVGCVVWDAAIVLCKFLENEEFFPPGYWNGKRVVDVGSGTGVVGLAAAVIGLARPHHRVSRARPFFPRVGGRGRKCGGEKGSGVSGP